MSMSMAKDIGKIINYNGCSRIYNNPSQTIKQNLVNETHSFYQIRAYYFYQLASLLLVAQGIM